MAMKTEVNQEGRKRGKDLETRKPGRSMGESRIENRESENWPDRFDILKLGSISGFLAFEFFPVLPDSRFTILDSRFHVTSA
jgi:hypothetical protein